MARKRNNGSMLNQIMEVIIDLTDMIWQVGAVVSAVFILLGFYSLDWAINKNNPVDPSTIEASVNSAIGWLFYSIPLILFAISILLVFRAIDSFQNHNRF